MVMVLVRWCSRSSLALLLARARPGEGVFLDIFRRPGDGMREMLERPGEGFLQITLSVLLLLLGCCWLWSENIDVIFGEIVS